MRLSLQPSGESIYGQQAKSHIVRLPYNDEAVLHIQANGTWRLIVRREGQLIDRGLFGSAHDILLALESEYFPQPSDLP